MAGRRKNYTVQRHERECGNCNNLDAIREPIVPGDKGKQKVYICRLDHEPVEKNGGVCDAWVNKRPGG